jgi:Ca2+-binding EF-hand superfamily protein
MATSFIMKGKSENTLELVLDLAFDIYDVNSNGKIDKKEMKKILLAFYECNGDRPTTDAHSRVNEIFVEYDRDHNEYLDKSEFKNFLISNDLSTILGF